MVSEARKQYLGRMQLDNHSMKSSKMVAKEVMSDARQLGKVRKHITKLLSTFHQAEEQGDIEGTANTMHEVLAELEHELHFIKEIADDDNILINRLKKVLEKVMSVTQSSTLPRNVQTVFLGQLKAMQVEQQTKLNTMRKRAMTEVQVLDTD